jgi:hypothetical protein
MAQDQGAGCLTTDSAYPKKDQEAKRNAGHKHEWKQKHPSRDENGNPRKALAKSQSEKNLRSPESAD